jgi:hypothetical protein
MSAESPRRARDERFLPADGGTAPHEPGDAEAGGETLAEKISRYRQSASGGGASGPAGHVVRHPREE